MTKAQLFNLCVYFLCLEQRALFQHRQPLASWARRQYERYRARLNQVRFGESDAVARSYRPARGMEAPGVALVAGNRNGGKKVTVRNQPRPCRESDGYAHPDDSVDRLGRLFVALRLHEKYGITFERYVEMVESGTWAI